MAKIRFIFYRILGNDLPPRHRRGQTLANLTMILDREPVFEGLEKRWIVNRIVDPKDEKAIISLLKKYMQQYQVIPFDREKFKKIPKACFNERLDEMIGLNKVRNLVLREGKKLARWTLVFDGNCYFTTQAWQKTAQACLISRSIKYIVVPMKRIVKGGMAILSEPQVIFRNDSKDEFDEDFGYGQDSKVDLLRRLGVPGVWDAWERELKDMSMKRRSKESGLFTIAGHIWRLPSGNEVAESNIQRRKECRDRGIVALMNKIDQW